MSRQYCSLTELVEVRCYPTVAVELPTYFYLHALLKKQFKRYKSYIACTTTNEIHVFDTHKWELVLSIKQDDYTFRSLTFLNPYTLVVVRSGKQTVEIWDIPRKIQTSTIQVEMNGKHLIASNNFLVSFDGRDLEVLNMSNNELKTASSEYMIFGAFVRGDEIITSSGSGDIVIWQVSTLERVKTIKTDLALHAIDTWNETQVLLATKGCQIYDLVTEKVVQSTEPFTRDCMFVKRCSANKAMLFAFNADAYYAFTWDTRNKTVDFPLLANTSNLYNPFCILGTFVMFRREEGIMVYDYESNMHVKTIQGEYRDVYCF